MAPYALGLMLAAWRAQRGLTQKALATAVGVSRPVMSRIEKGTRGVTPGELARLAAALQIDAHVLFDVCVPVAGPPTPMQRVQERLAQCPPEVLAAFEQFLATFVGHLERAVPGAPRRAPVAARAPAPCPAPPRPVAVYARGGGPCVHP
jgi:transcriptional regulator with XRE-family HTH domain